MRNARSILLVLTALTLASAGNLLAQRRGTDGSGGGSRPAPSGGGSSGGSSSGGGRTTSSGGGSRSSGGGRESSGSARPSGSTREGGSSASPSGSNRPTSGKIAGIRRGAQAAKAAGVVTTRGVYLGGCWDCNYWGWYHGRYGWYHGGWWYPRYGREPRESSEPEEGQGYLPYPYAENDGTGSTFVERRSTLRPTFGAVSGQFFTDVGSTTRAGRFAIEGAWRQVRAEAEYSAYSEPVATGTDRFQTYRIGVGMQPRLGNNAYLVAGIAARGVVLDDGNEAAGPEGELGVQVFPRRPLGLNVTGRIAGLSWTGSDYFTLRELNTTGSLFVGRIELQAGWHWMRVGNNAAFGGPMFGTRVWF